MQNIKDAQVELINKFKNYLVKFDRNFFKPEKNSLFYPATYSECIGSYILRKKYHEKKSFIKNFRIVLSDILYSLRYCKVEEVKKKSDILYNRIIVTWAFEKNFKKDGSIDDRYFNINSKSIKNALWFVIYQSEKIPTKIDKNIILFNPKSKRINIINLISLILENLKFLISANYFLSSISNYNHFSKIFIKNISPYINEDVKSLLIPYEGQPFQNKLIQYIEDNYSNIKTIGYIHSPPLALPSNFIYKNYCPKKIIVNGNDQFRCFSKILGWKKSDIILAPSFRFFKQKISINKIIFLPLNIKDVEKVIKSLLYLEEKKIINLKSYTVRNHPASKNSKKNLEAEKRINEIIKKLKLKKVNKKLNYSIFIGTSGSIIEALENGKKVIQITEENIFDFYSQKIWKNIMSKKISENIFIYRLRKKNQLIKLGKKQNNLKRILSL